MDMGVTMDWDCRYNFIAKIMLWARIKFSRFQVLLGATDSKKLKSTFPLVIQHPGDELGRFYFLRKSLLTFAVPFPILYALPSIQENLLIIICRL